MYVKCAETPNTKAATPALAPDVSRAAPGIAVPVVLAVVLIAPLTTLSACGYSERRQTGAAITSRAKSPKLDATAASSKKLPPGTTVARIAGHPIAKVTVDHWTAVFAHGGPLQLGLRGEPQGSARRRALALLISSMWIEGEAAREGLTPSGAAVGRALQGRERSLGGSSDAFRRRIEASGQTLADVRLELRGELALKAILAALERRSSKLTPREVESYYRAHRKQFARSEGRVADLVERLESPAAARALVRRIGTGKRFHKLAIHEYLERGGTIESTPEKAKLMSAIFAARLGEVSAPIKIETWWLVFVLRRVLPPRVRSLGEVRGTVVEELRASRRQALATAFDRSYRARWVPRTSCDPGYLAPGCAQYSGALGPYEDPFSSG